MSNLELAAAAWNAVRRPDDAPWGILPMGIKAKLADLAGKYRNGAKVAEGDYPPEGFAEKVAELAVADVPQSLATIFDPDKNFGNEIAEHEDVRIPSPTTEDVDPLKASLDVGSNEPLTERRVSNRRGLMDKPGNIENDRRAALTDRRQAIRDGDGSTETATK